MTKGTMKPPYIPIVDRPEVSETFADSVISVFVDGNNFKIDLAIKRAQFRSKDMPPTIKRYTSGRVVLTTEAAVELCNNLNQLLGVMTNPPKPPLTMN